MFGCFESIAGRLLFWVWLGEGFLLGLRPDLGGVWLF